MSSTRHSRERSSPTSRQSDASTGRECRRRRVAGDRRSFVTRATAPRRSTSGACRFAAAGATVHCGPPCRSRRRPDTGRSRAQHAGPAPAGSRCTVAGGIRSASATGAVALLSGFFAATAWRLRHGLTVCPLRCRAAHQGDRHPAGPRRPPSSRRAPGPARRGGYALIGIAGGVAGGLYGARFVKTLLTKSSRWTRSASCCRLQARCRRTLAAVLLPGVHFVDPIVALQDE